MYNIVSANELKEAICLLESRRTIQGDLVKEQFEMVLFGSESAAPLHSILANAFGSPRLRKDILYALLGLAAGYLSKKVVVGSSSGVFKKLLGWGLQFGVPMILANKSLNVRLILENVIHRFFGKPEAESISNRFN